MEFYFQVWLTSLDLIPGVGSLTFYICSPIWLVKDSGCQYASGMARRMQEAFREAKPDGPVSDGDTGRGISLAFQRRLISLSCMFFRRSSAKEWSSGSESPSIEFGTRHHVILSWWFLTHSKIINLISLMIDFPASSLCSAVFPHINTILNLMKTRRACNVFTCP